MDWRLSILPLSLFFLVMVGTHALLVSRSWAETKCLGVTMTEDVPKLIHCVDAKYPGSALTSGKSGWAKLNYCIEVDGTVSEVSVADSEDYHSRFADSFISALRQWKYETPNIGGKPHRLCNIEAFFSFFIYGDLGAGPIFTRKYRLAVDDIKGSRWDEAESAIEDLFDDDELNAYEADLLYALQARLFEAKGENQKAMRALERVAQATHGHFDDSQYVAALQKLFFL
jgi:hypothetical protein